MVISDTLYDVYSFISSRVIQYIFIYYLPDARHPVKYVGYNIELHKPLPESGL
jgi:hypothetical protein